MRRTRARSLLAATATAIGCAGLAATATTSSAATSFRATATATAVTAQVSNPDQFPLGATVEMSGETAQAVTDQLGTSTGFASFPYPGDFVVGAPGLVAGAGGPSLGDYPLYVKSDRDTKPHAKAEGPGYLLEAVSQERSTRAQAVSSATDTAAFRSGRRHAEAKTVVGSDSGVKATATTDVENITVSGVLRIGRVASEVIVSRTASGALSRDSGLQVEGIAVGGQQVGLVDGQLVLAGTGQPLAASPLNDVMAQAGITMTTVAPVDGPEGRTGGALIVTVRNTNDSAGTTQTTYRLGGAAAFVSFAGAQDGGTTGGTDDVVSGSPPASFAPQPAPAGAEPVGRSEPIASDSGAAPGPQLAAGPHPPRTLQPAGTRLPLRNQAAWLYFCFVAASVGLLLSAHTIRRYGVKVRV